MMTVVLLATAAAHAQTVAPAEDEAAATSTNGEAR